MILNESMIILPKTQTLIDNLKNQPTDKERIEALENAITDIAVMLVGGENNG